MKKMILMMSLSFLTHVYAVIPTRYTELLDYVQPGPDQGKTGTCLFVSSTGAMELLANKLNDIKDPDYDGPFDLSEPFLIHAPKQAPSSKSFFEAPVYKFNRGYGVPAHEWPLIAWTGTEINMSAWEDQDTSQMTHVDLPEVETVKLFNKDSRWATGVLNKSHVDQIREALVKYQSPILINYNDNNYWHVILIVGFDDRIEGECYQTDPEACKKTSGSFYVRDSFGKIIELRDYDWFIGKANAAFVVKLKDPISDSSL